jgi:hypothetical protein
VWGRVAMQQVVRSSPIVRFAKSPASGGAFVIRGANDGPDPCKRPASVLRSGPNPSAGLFAEQRELIFVGGLRAQHAQHPVQLLLFAGIRGLVADRTSQTRQSLVIHGRRPFSGRVFSSALRRKEGLAGESNVQPMAAKMSCCPSRTFAVCGHGGILLSCKSLPGFDEPRRAGRRPDRAKGQRPLDVGGGLSSVSLLVRQRTRATPSTRPTDVFATVVGCAPAGAARVPRPRLSRSQDPANLGRWSSSPAHASACVR